MPWCSHLLVGMSNLFYLPRFYLFFCAAGTPYEGGLFRLKLVLGKEYPAAPPKGYFLTKIFHPNVSDKGDICVNTLKRDWKADTTLSHILAVIRCLLIVPFPESSLNDEAGKLFMESYDEYARRARLVTSVHALRAGAAPAAPAAAPSAAAAGGAGAAVAGSAPAAVASEPAPTAEIGEPALAAEPDSSAAVPAKMLADSGRSASSKANVVPSAAVAGGAAEKRVAAVAAAAPAAGAAKALGDKKKSMKRL